MYLVGGCFQKMAKSFNPPHCVLNVNPIRSGGGSDTPPPIRWCCITFFLSTQMLFCFGTFSLYLFDTLWENFDYFPYLGQEIWHLCWEELEISYYFLYKSVKTEILIKYVCFEHITSYLHHITILWSVTFSDFFFGFGSRDVTWRHMT